MSKQVRELGSSVFAEESTLSLQDSGTPAIKVYNAASNGVWLTREYINNLVAYADELWGKEKNEGPFYSQVTQYHYVSDPYDSLEEAKNEAERMIVEDEEDRVLVTKYVAEVERKSVIVPRWVK